MIPPNYFQYPFGEESCEHEVEVLKEKYQQFYYAQSYFNKEAIDVNTYLIVGRRGSGKSSLGKFFNFQSELQNAKCIDVNEPDVYNDVMQKVALRVSYRSDMYINWISKVWEYVIWSLILHEYKNIPSVAAACILISPKGSPARIISEILKHMLSKWIGDGGELAEQIEDFFSSEVFNKAREDIINIASQTPIIVAIDTIERYDKNDDVLMGILVGLIQCANKFNISYAPQGIHVKSFIAAEIFPHIKESAITNTTKFIRNPVYLNWRPKDLIRLVTWRFYKYLRNSTNSDILPEYTIWDDFNEVLAKMWFPFFGEKLFNSQGREENTFPYIIRHTQMRPRQLVVICNGIAKNAMEKRVFPYLNKIDIKSVINLCELDLANEVLNSYAKIYPRVAEIVDALRNTPKMFEGSLLDRVAHETAFAWPRGEYSPDGFRRLVTELGIVGRVRSYDENSGIIAADFEYTLEERLTVRSRDKCVIHPMFYSKLETQIDTHSIVYPFPNHPDFKIAA